MLRFMRRILPVNQIFAEGLIVYLFSFLDHLPEQMALVHAQGKNMVPELLQHLQLAVEGYHKDVAVRAILSVGRAVRSKVVENIGMVKNDLPFFQRIGLGAVDPAGTPLVHINNFPEIMAFSRKAVTAFHGENNTAYKALSR